MYSIKTELSESKRAKGVKKSVVKRSINHDDYRKILMGGTQSLVSMNTIRSEYHKVKTYKINKIGLSCYDDKRYILDNGCDTFAYGHCMIEG